MKRKLCLSQWVSMFLFYLAGHGSFSRPFFFFFLLDCLTWQCYTVLAVYRNSCKNLNSCITLGCSCMLAGSQVDLTNCQSERRLAPVFASPLPSLLLSTRPTWEEPLYWCLWGLLFSWYLCVTSLSRLPVCRFSGLQAFSDGNILFHILFVCLFVFTAFCPSVLMWFLAIDDQQIFFISVKIQWLLA